jgi:signal transduction histidine kinase
MLHAFINEHRDEIIARCHAKVFRRHGRLPSTAQLLQGIPDFLDQLVRTLEQEEREGRPENGDISGSADGKPQLSEVNVSASRHGKDLLGFGFSVDQLVHNYGDMCQAITELAIEHDAPCSIPAFRTLNRCMVNAIADAAKEFTYQRDAVATLKSAEGANLRLAEYSHQLRTSLSTALMAFEAARSGKLNLTGATGTILERNLRALTLLIDDSLSDFAAISGEPQLLHSFSLADFIGEAVAATNTHAIDCAIKLRVLPVAGELAISGDRAMLLAAVELVLHNAFAFSDQGKEVLLTAYAAGDHVIIDVKDQSRHSPDSGMNLAIVQKTVMTHEGVLSFQELPGDGRVLTISLPRYALPT